MFNRRFFVKEVYPNNRPKIRLSPPNENELIEILKTAKPSINLKKFIFSNISNCLGQYILIFFMYYN